VLHTLVLALSLAVPPAATPAAPAPVPPAAAPSPAGPPEEAVPLPEAPPAWAPAIERAQASARDFQQALQGRLAAALAQGGPPAAVDVCAADAQRIAAEVGASSGLKLGRTSDRLRNPANAPPAWARTFLGLAAGEKAADVQGVAVDLGGQLGVLLPIDVKATCLGCHGAPASISPKVKEVLARRYPRDQAVGYAAGDFRGYLWVEVRK
jgi:hypothetical protein